jgi:hypothetical protein
MGPSSHPASRFGKHSARYLKFFFSVLAVPDHKQLAYTSPHVAMSASVNNRTTNQSVFAPFTVDTDADAFETQFNARCIVMPPNLTVAI